MSLTLISDTFTDADNTALTAHTMNVGPGWTAVQGTYKIISNQLTLNSGNDNDTAITDAGASNYALSYIASPFASGASEDDPSIILRYVDASNYWLIVPTGAGHAITLYERVAGTFNQRVQVSASISSGGNYPIFVTVSGPVISCYVAGVFAFSYTTATSGQTSTKIGVRFTTSTPTGTPCTWDTLLVQSAVIFDAVSNSGYQSAASSLSWSHTWLGDNRMLSINVSMLSVTGTVTAMTYGGATCTLVGVQNVAGGTGRVEMWRICQNDASAPAAGANTISITLSGSMACVGTATSRSNVHQSSPTESFAGASGINTGVGLTADVVITPVTDGTTVESAIATSATSIAGVDTVRNNVSGTLGTGADQEFGPISPAAAHTSTWSEGLTSAWALAGYAIRPIGSPASGSGVGSATGAAVVAGVGDFTAGSLGAATGVSVTAGVGASQFRATASSTGAAIVAGVGAAIDGDTEIGTAAGSAIVTAAGASRMAEPGSAIGTAIATGIGASLAGQPGSAVGAAVVNAVGLAAITVAAVGSAIGAAIVGGVGVGETLEVMNPYLPARPDEIFSFRQRSDESSEYRQRPDEAL